MERKPSLKLPAAVNSDEWKTAETAICDALEDVLQPVGQTSKVKSMTINALVQLYEEVVYDVLYRLFGTHEEPTKEHPSRDKFDRPSKREQRVSAEMKRLRAEHKAMKQGKAVLTEQEAKRNSRRFHCLLKHQSHLRKARRHKKKMREAEVQQRKFREDPWKFGTEVFQPRNCGKPTFTAADAEEHFVGTYSDAARSTVYHAPPGCKRPPKPKFKFSVSKLEKHKLVQAVKKKRNKNAPGMNGIPFLLYKKCPKVLDMLLQIMNRVWSEKVIPESWQRAVIVLLAKSDILDDPKEFRPIALLNSEGRLFFTLMNWRLSDYMLKNKYIDTKVQKGFIEKLAGCVEHSETLHHALLDARKSKRNICVSWLDLANAYGSVRHSMVLFTLEWYWVPAEFAEIVYQYYEGLCATVLVGTELTCWFRFEIGVFQGCTLSTMLFDTAFNTVFERVSVLLHEYGYQYSGVDVTKLILGYADDICNMTHLARHNQAVVDVIQEWLEWSQTMKAKPKKCKATALALGKPVDPQLAIAGSLMEYIGGSAFKFLGKQIRADVSDKAARIKVQEELESAVQKLDKLLLTGSQKMWIFDAVLMSRISWDLLIHDMSPSFVAGLGALQTRKYKEWSHYAKTGNPTVFYRQSKHFGLQMKEMVPFFKKNQLIKCHLLSTSSDEDVCKLYQVRADREHQAKQSNDPVAKGTWRPTVELKPLLSEAKARKMIQGAQSGTGGLGLAPQKKKQDATAEERAEVLRAFEDITEEQRYIHSLSLEHFSEWVKWDNVLATDPQWTRWIMSGEDDLFRFNLAATEDVLPTPSVLKCWQIVTDASCKLCGHKNCTLRHILCGCQTALKQGRQTWRHDSILYALYQQIRSMRNHGAAAHKLGLKPKEAHSSFVSTKGNKFNTASTPAAVPLFETSDDWQLQFDITVKSDSQSKNAAFPPHIAATSCRPDAVIWSDKLETVVWIELTSPWEENMTKWHFRKHEKYNKLATTVRNKGWKVHPLCVEVGCRGFTGHNWQHMARTLNMKKGMNKRLKMRVAQVAQRCSYYLYLNHKNREWSHPPLHGARD